MRAAMWDAGSLRCSSDVDARVSSIPVTVSRYALRSLEAALSGSDPACNSGKKG